MHSAALFDMDGLLIDSERSIMNAWLAVAARFNIALSAEDYLPVVGRAAAESDAILTTAFGSRDLFLQAHASVAQELDAISASTGFPLKQGAKSLLSALAMRRIPCAVVSSSPRSDIEARLQAVGVLHFFTAVAGGDEVARGKPDPSIYRLAASRLGVAAEQCLAFEDSHNGAHAALAAGANLAIVPDLLQPTAEFAQRSLAVISSLDGALPHVDRWFRPANAHAD